MYSKASLLYILFVYYEIVYPFHCIYWQFSQNTYEWIALKQLKGRSTRKMLNYFVFLEAVI